MKPVALTLALAAMAPASACAQAEDAAQSGAEFRRSARFLYRAIALDACQPDQAARRATLLAPEIAAVRAFERKIATGPASTQIAFPRSDVEYAKANAGIGCLNYGEPAFADLYIKRARDSITNGLQRLRELAPQIPALAEQTPVSLGAAARFRKLVGELVWEVEGVCRITSRADNDVVLAASRAEFAKLRRVFGAGPLATHFAVAEADARLDMDETMTECASPGSEPASDVSRKAAAATRKRAAQIHALGQSLARGVS